MIAASKNIDNKIDKNSFSNSSIVRPYFTGEALFTIEGVNLPKEAIITLKGLEAIADLVKEPQYDNIYRRNNMYTKLEFILSFNPNKLLGVSDVYPEKLFVDYRIYINNDTLFNKDKTKVQVIDSHKNNAWVRYDASKTAKECLLFEIEENKTSVASKQAYYQKIDPDTVRFAKTGEVVLYDFLFNMTLLFPHNPAKGNNLQDFVIGDSVEDASKAFEKLVNGNYDLVREWIGNKNLCTYDDGEIAKIGGLLGISVDSSNSKSPKFYQEVFTDEYACCTFRESSRPRKRTLNGAILSTRLPKEVFERVTNETNPWRAIWNDNFRFQEFNTSTYSPPTTTIEDNGIEDAEIISDNDGFDLPF